VPRPLRISFSLPRVCGIFFVFEGASCVQHHFYMALKRPEWQEHKNAAGCASLLVTRDFCGLILSYAFLADYSDDCRRILHRDSGRSELQIAARCGVTGSKFSHLVFVGWDRPGLSDGDGSIRRYGNSFQRNGDCPSLGFPRRRTRNRLRVEIRASSGGFWFYRAV
jgi:hypothetical protein